MSNLTNPTGPGIPPSLGGCRLGGGFQPSSLLLQERPRLLVPQLNRRTAARSGRVFTQDGPRKDQGDRAERRMGRSEQPLRPRKVREQRRASPLRGQVQTRAALTSPLCRRGNGSQGRRHHQRASDGTDSHVSGRPSCLPSPVLRSCDPACFAEHPRPTVASSRVRGDELPSSS